MGRCLEKGSKQSKGLKGWDWFGAANGSREEGRCAQAEKWGMGGGLVRSHRKG